MNKEIVQEYLFVKKGIVMCGNYKRVLDVCKTEGCSNKRRKFDVYCQYCVTRLFPRKIAG